MSFEIFIHVESIEIHRISYPKSEKKLIACTKDYMPVCGCDNITYSNKCVAESEGLNTWTNGPCSN